MNKVVPWRDRSICTRPFVRDPRLTVECYNDRHLDLSPFPRVRSTRDCPKFTPAMDTQAIVSYAALFLLTHSGLLDAMRSDPMEHLILEDSVSTCNDTGYSCTSDCKTVQLCAAQRLFNLTHCPGYTFCDADNHACADDQMSCPNWRPPAFTCCDHGLFPDLYDCSRYYLCYKDQFGSKPEVYECEEGTAFDVETLSCTQKGGCAGSRAPVCSLETPTGALKDNPSIYYVCTLVDGVMYPQLCRCDQGYYDPMTTSCVTTPGEVGTTTSSGPDEFRCSEQGIFGDPESCEAYYVCSLSLQATHGFCVNGTHFNQTRHSCVLGTC
uniref:(California timema) hypothetical protein n=1 Tax=Timema californicum TaxID=61474 RepID=A0A7R9PDD3_TIMCA|nr:unnamed protein product [Timema californicum]